MKSVERKDLSSRTNEETVQLLASIDNNVKMTIKLGQLLEERGMTQRDLVRATGIGQNMISGFVNNRSGVKIGYAHIFAIMIALRVTDISELMEVDFPKDIKDRFDKEAADWKETKQPPTDIRKMIENSNRG